MKICLCDTVEATDETLNFEPLMIPNILSLFHATPFNLLGTRVHQDIKGSTFLSW